MKQAGIELKKAREKAGHTVREVQQKTRIPVAYLEALEAGESTPFTAEVYYIGSLRRYCQFLGINPVDYIEHYQSMKIAAAQLAPKKQLPFPEWAMPWMLVGVGIVVAVIVIGYFGALRRLHTQANKPKEPVVATTVENTVSTGQAMSLVDHAANAKLQLEISARNSTWVRIIADGERVYEGTVSSTTKKWIADSEYELVTGYYRNLNIRRNGMPLDLSEVATADGFVSARITGTGVKSVRVKGFTKLDTPAKTPAKPAPVSDRAPNQ